MNEAVEIVERAIEMKVTRYDHAGEPFDYVIMNLDDAEIILDRLRHYSRGHPLSPEDP